MESQFHYYVLKYVGPLIQPKLQQTPEFLSIFWDISSILSILYSRNCISILLGFPYPKHNLLGPHTQLIFWITHYQVLQTTNPFSVNKPQKTPQNFGLFCPIKLLVLDHLLLTYFFCVYTLTHFPKSISNPKGL